MACLSHPLLSLWQSWHGSIRNKTSELKCPVVCNRQKFHALLLNLLNGLGFFWVAGCSTFFLPGFQGCTRGEQESASQSVQLQHMETTAVFHEGHEWGMKKISFVWQEFQREKRMRLYQQVPLKVARTRSRWASIYYFPWMGEKHIFIFLFWCMLCKCLSWIKISALCTHRVLTGLPWQIKFYLLAVILPWLSVPSLPLGIVSLQSQQNGQNRGCANASADAVHRVAVSIKTPDMGWSTWCMGTHPCSWRGWWSLKLLQAGLWDSICQSGYLRPWLASHCLHKQATNLPQYRLWPVLEAITQW